LEELNGDLKKVEGEASISSCSNSNSGTDFYPRTSTVIGTFDGTVRIARQNWEYRLESADIGVTQAMLTRLGNDGWELVLGTPGGHLVFKRPR